MSPRHTDHRAKDLGERPINPAQSAKDPPLETVSSCRTSPRRAFRAFWHRTPPGIDHPPLCPHQTHSYQNVSNSKLHFKKSLGKKKKKKEITGSLHASSALSQSRKKAMLQISHHLHGIQDKNYQGKRTYDPCMYLE